MLTPAQVARGLTWDSIDLGVTMFAPIHLGRVYIEGIGEVDVVRQDSQ